MYGEFKGRVIVRIPEGDDPDEVLRLEVLDPELARQRYQGKIVLAKRSSIRALSGRTHGSLKETDILWTEPQTPSG
ncbi:hypothetical protein NIM87_05925 [Devosia sp. XJ19-1]|uniref:Uncharacterized protein n=1 Tax=Devosia ureilytica TaxID=2952754 RepID=A0A9Q4AMF1_9HYPH|nr:hypothetical protein [Devosia ureilytica]MCP8883030.1 hypothetical protein [Devosia ureilytica]MCP8886602.1 hypothetical protein [Devosia ureilytica]